MNNRIIFGIITPVAYAFPLLAYAATIFTASAAIFSVLNLVIEVLIILATVVDCWGAIMYLSAGDDQERTAKAILYINMATISLGVMIPMWGIVLMLENTFGVGGIAIPITVGGI